MDEPDDIERDNTPHTPERRPHPRETPLLARLRRESNALRASVLMPSRRDLDDIIEALR